MSQEKNQEAVVAIAGKHLGKVGGEGYKDTYDPELLVKIPRYLNREAYGIKEENLPFVGLDVWNAYEVSAITLKGLPVVGMLKITCPANSKYHVESKSIKLYLNSFNMTRIGMDSADCIRIIEETVAKDLTTLLEAECQVKMFTSKFDEAGSFKGYAQVGAMTNLDALEFDSYKSDASQLKVANEISSPVRMMITSDLLRSNCRVTNQPDWGDVYININSKKVPDIDSIAKYIVSHRQVSHFHEEICEMVFTHLSEAFEPEELMVACLYTRRGGLDINPVRATNAEMIPSFFTDINIRLDKTLRQ